MDFADELWRKTRQHLDAVSDAREQLIYIAICDGWPHAAMLWRVNPFESRYTLVCGETELGSVRSVIQKDVVTVERRWFAPELLPVIQLEA